MAVMGGGGGAEKGAIVQDLDIHMLLWRKRPLQERQRGASAIAFMVEYNAHMSNTKSIRITLRGPKR